MAQLFANAARSTLTASITSTSTQLQINPADQALFPVATGADWFKVALEDSSGNLEFMKVQRAVGQSLLTITERATEDATKFPARAFIAGSLVELRMTAFDLASSIAHPSLATGAHAATAVSVAPTGSIAATDVQAAIAELASEKQEKTGTFPFSQISDFKRWETGEWVLSSKTTPPAGTVVPNGGTIGSAASGATNRANADTADLFAHLWSVTSNADYPIQDATGAASTRGASAAADFAANKRFPLPNIQDGDALVAAVSSAVLSRTVGENLAHTHTITVDGVPDHTHTFSVTGGNGGTSQITAAGGQAPATASTTAAGGHTHTASASSSGGTKNLAAGLMTRVYYAL